MKFQKTTFVSLLSVFFINFSMVASEQALEKNARTDILKQQIIALGITLHVALHQLKNQNQITRIQITSISNFERGPKIRIDNAPIHAHNFALDRLATHKATCAEQLRNLLRRNTEYIPLWDKMHTDRIPFLYHGSFPSNFIYDGLNLLHPESHIALAVSCVLETSMHHWNEQTLEDFANQHVPFFNVVMQQAHAQRNFQKLILDSVNKSCKTPKQRCAHADHLQELAKLFQDTQKVISNLEKHQAMLDALSKVR
jgi:hypothetical protein